MPRIALTTLVVLMAGAAACGGGSPSAGGDYCGVLGSDAALVGSFNGAGSPDFARAERVGSLADRGR